MLIARKRDVQLQRATQKFRNVPWCYDREMEDLLFFYKAVYGISDLNVHNYVPFVTHQGLF
jgi:hypothetical protein